MKEKGVITASLVVNVLVVSSNPARSRYKLTWIACFLQKVGGYLKTLRRPPPIKCVHHETANSADSGV